MNQEIDNAVEKMKSTVNNLEKKFGIVRAGRVSVPEKLSRCADPASFEDSFDVDPRYPKSCNMKSALSCEEPVMSR